MNARRFLYETLLFSDPDAAIEVSLLVRLSKHRINDKSRKARILANYSSHLAFNENLTSRPQAGAGYPRPI